jgi:glutathione S-transferase
MITLYGGGPFFGLPEASPFATKTEVQLQMADLEYVKARAMPAESPKGQIPFIDDDGERVADSTFIRAHIERKYGVDLDEGLTVRQRAEAWAIERMLENHFSYAVFYGRFFIPGNFDKGPAHFFDQAPEESREQLREAMKAGVAATYHAVGIGRHAPDEIEWLGVRSLEALSDLLGDRPYLMGARPCGTDATAFAMLAGLLTPFFDAPLRRRAEGYGALVAYTDRMMARFYPGFAWSETRAAA